jgi:hypothetical protein
MDEVKLFPAWRQVEADLMAQGLVDGSVIPMQWLRDAFGIAEAQTVAEHDRNRMLFNSMIGELKASLLENHCIDLRVVDGVGYMVVPPDQQTGRAMKDRSDEIMRVMDKLRRQVTYVRTAQLTDSQRAENASAQAKVAALCAMNRQRLGVGRGA